MFEALYSAASAPLRGWISSRAGTVERLIEEAQHGTGHVPFGSVGSVVRFNAEARRWVVVGVESPDRVHLVALSGALSSGESTNTPLRRLTRDVDQRVTFTGTHARALEKRAREAAGLRGARLRSGVDAAVRQAPAPVAVAPRPERAALAAEDFRQGAVRSKIAMHAALVPRPKADPTYQRQDAANAARLAVAFEALARAAEAGVPFPRMTRLGDVRTSVRQRSPWVQTMVERYLPASADAYQGDGLALIRDLDKAIQVEAVKRDVGDVEGYHPTPRGLAEEVIRRADIRPGMTVLEPSAGSGSLADAAVAAGGLVSVVERDPRLRRVLETKGYALIGDDALTVQGLFDRVVMNPPFERGAEIDHVRAAYANLKPGGRLVAIMSEGPFFRSDKKATSFRDWLESVRGTSRPNAEGAFKGSERSTGVRTRIVVVDKPR